MQHKTYNMKNSQQFSLLLHSLSETVCFFKRHRDSFQGYDPLLLRGALWVKLSRCSKEKNKMARTLDFSDERTDHKHPDRQLIINKMFARRCPQNGPLIKMINRPDHNK